jgi:hypothetical protein
MSKESLIPKPNYQPKRPQEAVESDEPFQTNTPISHFSWTQDNILHLQRMIGNQAVQRMIVRQKANSSTIHRQPPEHEAEAPVATAEESAAQAQPAPTTGTNAEGQPPTGSAADANMYTIPEVPIEATIILVCNPSTPTSPDDLSVPTITGRFGDDANVADFAQNLALFWGARLAQAEQERAATQARRRRRTAPPVPDPTRITTLQQERLEWLANDFTLTMQAAIGRYGRSWLRTAQRRVQPPRQRRRRRNEPAPDAEQLAEQARVRFCEQQEWLEQRIEGIKHGWMVGRREYVLFETTPQPGVQALPRGFGPPRQVAAADRVPIPANVGDSTEPPIAPEVANFLVELRQIDTNFRASNYGGHGGGTWNDAGFSLDLYLTGAASQTDDRGFWQPDNAVAFLLNLNQVVDRLSGTWRVLYNDFTVAQRVNSATGSRNVAYMGSHTGGTRLNWHGPAPMVLHFHLDISLPALPAPSQPTGAAPPQPGSTP